MTTKWLAIAVSSLLLLITLDFVRRGRLTFKYAFGWLLLGVLGLFFELFDHLLFEFSAWLGFVLPSNFVFFSTLVCFVFLSLLLTVFLCQQDNRNDTMAQKIGILEMELEEVKKQLERKGIGE